MSGAALAFARWVMITFALFFVLCWTPFRMLPGFVAAAFSSPSGAMMFLLIAVMPLGGLGLLLATFIWREDFTGFWKEMAGLAGAWVGVILGSQAGTTLSEVI